MSPNYLIILLCTQEKYNIIKVLNSNYIINNIHQFNLIILLISIYITYINMHCFYFRLAHIPKENCQSPFK